MKSKEERKKIQDELMSIYEEVKKELLKNPGVQHVAVGLKERAGRLTDEIVFQVYVNEKKAEENLSVDEIIPKEIHGFKTDVLRLPKVKKRLDSDEYRPVKGGVKIANGKGDFGTLGCFARIKSDGSMVLLSNHHVLMSNDAGRGDLIGQPTIEHKCCCCCAYIDGEIGIIESGFDDELVDCAIAKIDSDIPTDIIINNNLTTTEIRIFGRSSTIIAGDFVKKIGCKSGLTSGVIHSINGPADEKTNQILIRPDEDEVYKLAENGKLAFSDHGDSGSVILNSDDEIIGLLWGGDPDSFDVDETFACKIDDVLDVFRNAGTEIEILITPADRSSREPVRFITRSRVDHDLRRQLLETARGEVLVSLFEMHQKEVLKIINNNRRVMSAWHRQNGPAFIAHLIKSVRDPAYQVPGRIGNITIQEMLTTMAIVLKECGGALLKKDIETHALQLINDTYGVTKVQEFIHRLNKENYAHI